MPCNALFAFQNRDVHDRGPHHEPHKRVLDEVLEPGAKARDAHDVQLGCLQREVDLRLADERDRDGAEARPISRHVYEAETQLRCTQANGE